MSLRSPRNQGFTALNNMNYENENENNIPLTNVPTHRSASSGARKQGDFATQSTFQDDPGRDDEKKGLFKRRGGRRKIRKLDSKRSRMGTDEDTVKVNGLGRFYSKIINFSVATRYLVYVLPIALVLAVPIVIYAVTNPSAFFVSTGVRVYLFWTWIEIIWLSIWVSKLVSKMLPWVFMFVCGVVSSGTRKYAKILEALEMPLSFVGWAVTVLVTFTALTSEKLNGSGWKVVDNRAQQPRWITVVKNLLGPALIASLIFLIEKTVIQLISINYHRRSFAIRIKESKHNIYLLGLLYDASRTLFPMYCAEFADEDYVINDSIEALLAKSGNKNHARSGSATPLRLLGDVGRLGDKVTSVFGNVAHEITGKQVFNPNSAHSIVIEALEKTRSSEALAKRLWFSFVVEGKESLYADDVEEVLGPGRKEEAEEIFAALDNDGNGDISLDEMILKVVEIGRDRKSISASMRDVGQAIGVLDQVIVTVLFVIVIFVFVAFQDTNFVTTLATAGTTLLSLSFVFAASVQEFLGSCIFLFVKHPYDVGDRVDIVGPEKELLVVEQISLLYTIFKRIDTMKMVQVPNIVLNNLWVENVTRSKAMKEQLDMFISFDTSLEDIEILRSEMEAFVRASENARDFQPDIILEATGIGNMDKLQLRVEIRHKSNWHNETVRAARRSKFMCALVLALRKIPIYAPGGGGEALGGPTNPGYTVSIPDSLAAEARAKAASDKEAKRLIPTPSADPTTSATDLASASETKAADSLNARRPAADAAHLDVDHERDAWNNRSGNDDATLASRDNSLERQRSDDIDDLRQGLLKRESTRGRRRPGERLPPIPSAGAPGLSVTEATPRTGSFPAGVRDEEARLGGPLGSNSPYSYPTPYAPPPPSSNQQSIPGTAAPNQAYSMYPTPSLGSRGAQQQLPLSQQQAQQGQQQGQVGYSPFPPAAQVTQAQQGESSSSQGRLRRLSLGFKNSSANSANSGGAQGGQGSGQG